MEDNRTVLVDHRDSFTHNVSALLRRVMGISPDIISYDDLQLESLSKYDFIVLSPGPGFPDEYSKTFALLDRYADKKTILGICLGHQIIARHAGADLYRLPHVSHGQPVEIIPHPPTRLFKGLSTGFTAALYHSWAVDKKRFPEEYAITAYSREGVIMALEHRSLPIAGVQFHPESFITVQGEKIISNFINRYDL